MTIDKNRVTMTHGDFGVCLATLVQAESFWEFQAKNLDGEIPGGFTHEEAVQILDSIREVKLKVETILEMAENLENDDHIVVS